jgi:hypothetical protein
MTDESGSATDRVVLVQCVSTKRDGEHEARDLYDSRLWRAQREYAEATGDRWYIMSAEHGLVEPTERLENYDTFIGDVDTDEWAESVGDALSSRLFGDETVVLTAGAKYADPVTPELEHRFGVEVLEPFRGDRLHARITKMREAAADTTQQSLEGFA